VRFSLYLKSASSGGFIGDETAGCALARQDKGNSTVSTRRRVKQVSSLHERLVSFAENARERASLLPPGEQQDALLEKARQADAAVRLNNWANSSELRPPK
jgi:hypothetical protein